MKDEMIIDNQINKNIIDENRLIDRLKFAEEQIKNGDVTDANTVFKQMRAKYGY